MRILLINQYAGAPSLGMEYRPHWLALEWQRLGHQVLVVAGDHSHLRRVQPRPGRSTIEGVDFLTLRTSGYTDNGPLRFANLLAFRAQLYARSRQLVAWRPDVVIASSTHPMDVRPGLRIANKAGAIFVHEVHDLWPLTPRLLAGMSENHPMIRWMQREEDLACRKADLVVSLLPATLPYLQSRGLSADRWAHVPNGVPVEALESHVNPQAQNEVFRVGYFGGHGKSNDLDVLLEVARLLQDDGIEFHLTGSGPQKPALQVLAGGLPNVHFHDEVAPQEARERMAEMDALCIVGRADALYQHGISMNKIFEYMAAGRPVIQALEAPESPVIAAGCGLQCSGNDAEAIARTVRSLADVDLGTREAMGFAGQVYVKREATYPALAARFVNAIEQTQQR